MGKRTVLLLPGYLEENPGPNGNYQNNDEQNVSSQDRKWAKACHWLVTSKRILDLPRERWTQKLCSKSERANQGFYCCLATYKQTLDQMWELPNQRWTKRELPRQQVNKHLSLAGDIETNPGPPKRTNTKTGLLGEPVLLPSQLLWDKPWTKSGNDQDNRWTKSVHP